MPRKEKPRKIGNASEKNMKVAVNMVLRENYSVRQAATACDLKFQTLARYVKKQKINDVEEIRMIPNYQHRKIFTEVQERYLASYLKTCRKMAYGLSTEDCRRLAYELAAVNELHMAEYWTRIKLAGMHVF